jgi:RNA polymerase sigma-70 factor, ECF subfamily
VTGGISKDDREELKDFYNAKARELLGYACCITRGDEKLAQDLVQDTFMAAAARWRDVRQWGAERQMLWLRRTLHNLAVTSFRRAALDRGKQEAVWNRYRPRDADTHEEALAAIALARCWEVIRQMPTQMHLAARMKWAEDMTISQIADALGIAEGTVSAHLATARRRLRAAAGPYAPFDLGDGGRHP